MLGFTNAYVDSSRARTRTKYAVATGAQRLVPWRDSRTRAIQDRGSIVNFYGAGVFARNSPFHPTVGPGVRGSI